MVIPSCLGFSEKGSVCSENTQSKKEKTRSMVTFCGSGWREKQKDILQKQFPGRVLQERCSKIFNKAYRKTRADEPFLKKYQDVGVQPYLKKGSCIGFVLWNFKTLQNSFFIVQPWIAAPDLIEYLENLIII